MNRCRIFAAILCGALAGCTTLNQEIDEPRVEPIYRTGSRLPVKDGVAATARTMDKSTQDRLLRPNPVPGGSGN